MEIIEVEGVHLRSVRRQSLYKHGLGHADGVIDVDADGDGCFPEGAAVAIEIDAEGSVACGIPHPPSSERARA